MVTPHCKVHGPMKLRHEKLWWECPGFDGEGCSLGLIPYELVRHAVSIPGVTLVMT